MGSCTRRHFLLSTCFLQMLTIIERQVFDFLGYMWAPIFVNFFQILFVIFGFYGAYHFRVKYIITYLLWSFLWIGWNAFLICFYLDVGELDKNSDLLNLGTGSVSWFEVNGYGCKPTYPTNITSDDPFRPIRPESVDDCLLEYPLIEVIHSGVQCALALLGILGAILISYIFLDEDDRFDFMNGDAKSPQHTVVHPMYVSYTSIPTSASATMLSNKHHHHQHHNQPNHHQQQHTYNNNTFLIHSNSNTPNASKNNTLNSSRKILYSPKNNKVSATTTTIIPTATAALTAMQKAQQQQEQKYYDDSTAKADHQLVYTNNANNNNMRQQLFLSPTSTTSSNTAYQQQQPQQQQHVAYHNINNNFNNNNNNNTNNTNSSLSYASLQKYSAQNSVEFLSSNSNSNLNMAASLRGSAAAGVGGVGLAVGALSSSNYSIANSLNNNNNNNSTSGSGRFARIHAKPKPPKSLSYSSFINSGSGVAVGPPGIPAPQQQQQRTDIRYTQMSNEQLAAHVGGFGNFEESFEDDLDDDIISMQNFKADAVTYVPFQKPVPGSLYVGGNNNPSYASLNSNYSGNNNSNNITNTTTTTASTTNHSNTKVSPNNNGNSSHGLGLGLNHPLTRDNSQLFLSNNNDLLLERRDPPPPLRQAAPPYLNPANRAIYQQNGLPFQTQQHSAHSNSRPPRPSNIPLPTVPHQYVQSQYNAAHSPISPSAVTPPPPPAPRPHIFAPRSGHAPYPDLSPEVTEKYSMPTQYVPRSPVASRIARRQRQQQQHERSHLANTSANFCDQIRDAPPGYIDTGFNIVRAKSHERLSTAGSRPAEQQATPKSKSKDAAPQVNRRSGRTAGGKTRPRSYCNSSSAGGEGVIRGAVLTGRAAGGADVVFS